MNPIEVQIKRSIKYIDDELSKRKISLDPEGYFIIKIDLGKMKLIVEHYLNHIDRKGRAIDPETGEPIGCKTQSLQQPNKIFTGRSAKEVGIQISEGKDHLPLSRLDHALYIGRELQRAEECLKAGKEYIQD